MTPLPAAVPGAHCAESRNARLREWLLRRRDRLLSSAAFQRLAVRFPPTRGISRRRAKALFDLTAGFVYSQVLLACVRLNLLEQLAAQPLSAQQVARRTGLPAAGAARLLSAASALRLLQRRGGDRYGLGDLGAAMLGNPGIAAMVAHHHLLYADLADPVSRLRRRGGGRLADFWPYAGADAATAPDVATGPYSELMAASQRMIADTVLDACSLRRHHRLLDVAGGDGSFALRALERWPHLQATVFDLPAVAARAAGRFAAAGLQHRAAAAAGDMLRRPLPADHDLITLVRVLHDHDDAPALALLRSARAALPTGGRLLVAEPLAGTAGAQSVQAYFDMYLWAMGSGQPRSAGQLRALIRRAGFTRCREKLTLQPLLARVLVAHC